MKTIFNFTIAFCFYFITVSAQTEKFSSTTCIPVPSVCNPVTQDSMTAGSLGIGITFVGLNQIHNPSASHSGTLEEFTCTDSTSLNIAQPYAFEVHTGHDYEESVTAWIDFSNDGAFTSQEIVFHDSAEVYMHTGYITIPNGVLNTFTPIRMRVGSEYAGNPGLDACSDPLYGHYEDYKIFYGVNIGVTEIEQPLISTVYPNPVLSSSKITFGNDNTFINSELHLSIYNCFGQLVSEKEIPTDTEITIERGNFSNGLYFFELNNAHAEKIAGKFLVE